PHRRDAGRAGRRAGRARDHPGRLHPRPRRRRGFGAGVGAREPARTEAGGQLVTDDRPPCDHQVDVDDSTWFECELPMHHPGPHKYTFTWENEPYGPQLPVTRHTPIWVPEA